MIPNGLRAHAEFEAAQDATQEQQLAPSDDNSAEEETEAVAESSDESEGGENILEAIGGLFEADEEVAATEESNANYTLKLTTTPTASEGYWTNASTGDTVTELSVPAGAYVQPYSLASDTIFDIWSFESGFTSYYEVQWHNTSGKTFQGWYFNNTQITSADIPPSMEGNSTLAAALEPPAPVYSTVTLQANPADSGVFKENGSVITQVFNIPNGAIIAGGIDNDSEFTIYENDTYEVVLHTIEFVPSGEYIFKYWKDNYKLVDSDYIMVANCSLSCTVKLPIEGVYEGDEDQVIIDNYDYFTGQLIAPGITELKLPKGYELVYAFDPIGYDYDMTYGYTDTLTAAFQPLGCLVCNIKNTSYVFKKWSMQSSQVLTEDEYTLAATVELQTVKLNGVVTDNHNNPLDKVNVVFEENQPGSNGVLQYEDLTDDHGAFHLLVKKGHGGTLTATKEGYELDSIKYTAADMLNDHLKEEPVLNIQHKFTVAALGNECKVELYDPASGVWTEVNTFDVPENAYFVANNGDSDNPATLQVFGNVSEEPYDVCEFRVSTEVEDQIITWGCQTGQPITIEGDMTQTVFVYDEIVDFTIDASDADLHENFEVTYYEDGEVVYTDTPESFWCPCVSGMEYSFDEDGALTLSSPAAPVNGNGSYSFVVKPNPVDLYMFGTYTDQLTVEALTPNTVYTVDAIQGDINLNVNYDVIDLPIEEEVAASSAQTGDSMPYAIAGLSVLALVCCGFAVSRRKSFTK